MNQLGDFKKFDSDALGRRTIERDVANGTTQTSYAGNTIETHNPLGHVTQHIFDVAAGQIETRDALSGVTRIRLDSAGNVTGRVDSLGHSTTYQYNSRNRLVKVTDASSGETVLRYDLAGNVVSRKDALQNEVQYEYDVLGRKIKETQPDPDGAGPLPAPVTRYEYDVAGNVVKQIRVIDPATSPATDRITAYEYDGLNRKVKETLPDPDGTGPLASPVIQYEYDIAGNLAKVIDPLGRETIYEYDILNRKIKETQPDPDGAGPLTAPVLQFEYDVAGHLVKEIDALGGQKLYEYASGRNGQTPMTVCSSVEILVSAAVDLLPCWDRCHPSPPSPSRPTSSPGAADSGRASIAARGRSSRPYLAPGPRQFGQSGRIGLHILASTLTITTAIATFCDSSS